MRGVPRERLAISSAPSGSSSTPRIVATRRRIAASSSCVVVVEPGDEAEAVAQRSGDEPGARGRADEREARQVEPDRARARALADHDVEAEVLHRGIEDSPRRRVAGRCTSSMNSTSPSSRFVRIAARSPARSSAGPLVGCRRAPISLAMMPARLVLPRPGGPASSTWSTACPRCLRGGEHDLEVLAQARLTDELVEVARPQRRLFGDLGRVGLGLSSSSLIDSAPAHRQPARTRSASRRSSSTVPSSPSWPSTSRTSSCR